jgi:ATP diphosphatase
LRTIEALIEVMAALRTPVTGCPWDLEQSFATIAPYTIEEAYEVADAIARGDMADLKEELGDLLLQVVYHARLAQEEGAFCFADVVEGITRKMLRRHPHVFGDEQARTAGMAKGAWERIKAEEKAQKAADRARRGIAPRTRPGLLDDVPVGMAALTRAIKLQDKAAKVGFDWPSLAPVLGKLKEEIAELEEALRTCAAPHPQGSHTGAGSSAASGVSHSGPDATTAHGYDDRLSGDGPAPTAAIEEEFGDLLFVMANVARHLKLDPEAALRGANEKFRRRFAYIEAELAKRGRTPTQSTLEEMDAIWNEVRARDKRA